MAPMRDEWTRRMPDGRIVRYTREVDPAGGAIVTATISGRTKALEVDDAPTREEVEEHFEILGFG
jgi:hypothetical protein